jgi:hypothetical protein
MAQTTRIKGTVNVSAEPAAGFSGGVAAAVQPIDVIWPSGTGAAAADRYGVETGSLSAAGTVTLDLSAFAGPRGADIAMADVRAICIELDAACSIEPGASNGWDGLGTDFFLTLPAGKYWFIAGADPSMPVSGTNKTVLLTAGAAAVDYQITAIGTSA